MKKIFESATIILDNENCCRETLLEVSRKVLPNIVILEKSYPEFLRWYQLKVVPGLLDGSRAFIIEMRSGKIAGVAILKSNSEEKKICTINVSEEYKSRGLGFRLFEKSMLLLGEDKPLATVSEDRYAEFYKIFRYFDYEFTGEYKGMYLPSKREFSFNGFLM